jgi:hypothetical protein
MCVHMELTTHTGVIGRAAAVTWRGPDRAPLLEAYIAIPDTEICLVDGRELLAAVTVADSTLH